MSRLILSIFFLFAIRLSGAPRINEVQSGNTSLPDPHGQRIDWIEIHNPSAQSVNLIDHYLSDSLTNRLKHRFGDTTIPAGGYLLVWCGSAADFPVTAPYPSGQLRILSFAISSSGEAVVLTAPDGATTISEFPARAITAGTSMGRGMGDEADVLYFYGSPTPGTANSTSGVAVETPDAPVFDVAPGMHTSSSLTVAISPPTGNTGGVIRYTLDGSDPTASSPASTGSLTLDATTSTNMNSWIPTNSDNNPGPPLYEGWQAPASQPFRINVLRARVFKPGAAPGRIRTASYLLHPSGTARYSLPVVSIATTPANFFSNETGIYVPGFYNNLFQSGSAWERPGHVEFFETDGSLAFSGEIGIRLHGNTTRSRPRKSLRVYSRNPDGPSTFLHRIFPQKPVDRFDTFLLRNSGNDWGNSLFRDALVTTLAGLTGLDVQSSRPAIVFISGEYWGIHNLRDRIDEGFFQHHYGLSSSQFSQIEMVPDGQTSFVVEDNGDPSGVGDFTELLDRATSPGFANAAGYAELASRIDIDNFIDYHIHGIWSGNTDWPGNNYRLWRTLAADTAQGANPRHDGRWRWILFDTDFALGSDFQYVPGYNTNVLQMAQFNSLAHATSDNGEFFSNKEIATRLLRKALENPEFRQRFVSRFADLLNTSLSSAHTGALLDEFVALYGPEIPEHVNRWRQPVRWVGDVARIRSYLQARPSAVRGHIASAFGLDGTADLTVDVGQPAQGTVEVNSIGIAASTAGVGAAPYPWTGVYFQEVPVTLMARPAAGHRFVSWRRKADAVDAITLAQDTPSNSPVWSNGGNTGSGFGTWSLTATTTNTSRAGHFTDLQRGGWGLYANNGNQSRASRTFTNALEPGRTFSIRIRHGSVESSGEVGVELADQVGNVLLRFKRPGSSSFYWINDQPTSVPSTNQPIDIDASSVSSGSLQLRILPTGGSAYETIVTIPPAADPVIRRFTVFNQSAGSGSGADLFVSNLRMTERVGNTDGFVVEGTDASITTTLTASTEWIADFEPLPSPRQVWLTLHSLDPDQTEGPTAGADTADPDADGWPNLMERALGLDPLRPDGTPPWQVATSESGVVRFTWRIARGQSDLTVTAETNGSPDMHSTWNSVQPVLLDDTHADHLVYRVDLETRIPAGFVRLKVRSDMATPPLTP